MRLLYRQKTYKAGDYKEVYIYPNFTVDQIKGRRRKRKYKKSSEAQKRLNKKESENRLVRLLNANFTSEDIAFDLTYEEGKQPINDEQARRDLENFFRRLKRYRKKNGLPELKYIGVTEKGKISGKYHHHTVINGGIDVKTLSDLWGKGYTKLSALRFDEFGLTAKGKYMMKQSLYFHTYIASRNLIHPQPTISDGRFSERKVEEMFRNTDDIRLFEKSYEGYRLAEADAYYNETNGGFYLLIRLYKKEAKIKRK